MTIDWGIVFQTLLLLAAIVGSFVRLRERITQVEVKVEFLEGQVSSVPGISRAVARLEGRIEQ